MRHGVRVQGHLPVSEERVGLRPGEHLERPRVGVGLLPEDIYQAAQSDRCTARRAEP